MHNVRWYFPDLQEERDEIKLQSKLLGVSAFRIVDALKSGKMMPLSNALWSQLENTDSFGIKTLDDAVPLADDYGKDIDRVIDGFESGGSMPAPMVITFDDRPPYLVGGNTRLMVAKALGVTPTVLVGHIEDLTKHSKNSYRPSMWWVTS